MEFLSFFFLRVAEGSGCRSALIALLTDLSEGEGLLSLRGLKELACHKLSRRRLCQRFARVLS